MNTSDVREGWLFSGKVSARLITPYVYAASTTGIVIAAAQSGDDIHELTSWLLWMLMAIACWLGWLFACSLHVARVVVRGASHLGSGIVDSIVISLFFGMANAALEHVGMVEAGLRPVFWSAPLFAGLAGCVVALVRGDA